MSFPPLSGAVQAMFSEVLAYVEMIGAFGAAGTVAAKIATVED